MSVDKVAAAASRLESVCSAFMRATFGMDEDSARELVPLLQRLEEVHVQIVTWVARKRKAPVPAVMFTKDVRKILKR